MYSGIRVLFSGYQALFSGSPVFSIAAIAEFKSVVSNERFVDCIQMRGELRFSDLQPLLLGVPWESRQFNLLHIDRFMHVTFAFGVLRIIVLFEKEIDEKLKK